jgi:hypothetical protein
MARAAAAAQRALDTGEGDEAFSRAKLLSCLYYARQVLPHGEAYAQAVGAQGLPEQDLAELVS